jgi:hypothetical protein
MGVTKANKKKLALFATVGLCLIASIVIGVVAYLSRNKDGGVGDVLDEAALEETGGLLGAEHSDINIFRKASPNVEFNIVSQLNNPSADDLFEIKDERGFKVAAVLTGGNAMTALPPQFRRLAPEPGKLADPPLVA